MKSCNENYIISCCQVIDNDTTKIRSDIFLNLFIQFNLIWPSDAYMRQ